MPLGTSIVFEPFANKAAVPVTQLTPLPVQIGAGAVSPFGAVLTAERTPIIELNSSFGLTALRDIEVVAGTGAAAAAGTGEILLNTGTTASSISQLWSAERGRYIPGYAAEVGVGVRVPVAPTGDQFAKWGLLSTDEANGFLFGRDSGGLFAEVIRNGSTTQKTYQADFNIDKGDGSGPSGVTLSETNGNIFQIQFTWYGYGQVVFGIIEVAGSFQRFIPLHQFRPTASTSIVTPNLPIYAEVNNGTSTTNLEMFVGGRQYSIMGKYLPKYRLTGQERTGVAVAAGVVEPLVSFRNKTSFKDRSLQIENIFAEVQTNPCIVEVYMNGVLTAPVWATPTNATPAETSVETDVSATDITGGVLVWSGYFPSGAGANLEATDTLARLDIPENQIVTLAARAIGGAATVSAHFRVREEW